MSTPSFYANLAWALVPREDRGAKGVAITKNSSDDIARGKFGTPRHGKLMEGSYCESV